METRRIFGLCDDYLDPHSQLGLLDYLASNHHLVVDMGRLFNI